MKTRTDRMLAEGVCESIQATTPATRNPHAAPRIGLAVALAWLLVAVIAFITLAAASSLGA